MTAQTTLDDPYQLTIFGKPVAGITIDSKTLNSRLRKLFEGAKPPSPTLAYIHGIKMDSGRLVLPEPVLLVMVGGGAGAAGWRCVASAP